MNVRDVWAGPMRVSFVEGDAGLEFVVLGDIELDAAEFARLREVFEAYDAGALDALVSSIEEET